MDKSRRPRERIRLLPVWAGVLVLVGAVAVLVISICGEMFGRGGSDVDGRGAIETVIAGEVVATGDDDWNGEIDVDSGDANGSVEGKESDKSANDGGSSDGGKGSDGKTSESQKQPTAQSAAQAGAGAAGSGSGSGASSGAGSGAGSGASSGAGSGASSSTSSGSNIGRGKTIYLTFDDGPSGYTGKLLDVLKKYGVKATFFVTYNGMAGRENMVKREFDEGHTVALHSYTHDYKKIYASEKAYFDDLYALQAKVKAVTGQDAWLIRFPGGSSNTVSSFNKGIMTRLTKAVQEKGFEYFDWNVTSGDAGGTTSTNTVYNNVTNALSSGQKNFVVLQHDIKGFSVDAVEAIIKYGKAQGFTFRALDKDAPKMHHGVNN